MPSFHLSGNNNNTWTISL